MDAVGGGTFPIFSRDSKTLWDLDYDTNQVSTIDTDLPKFIG